MPCRVVLSLGLLLLLAPPAFAADAFFSGVGDLPGGRTESLVSGMSPDGSMVVGTSNAEKITYVGTEPIDFGRRAGFVWTRSGGIQEIVGSQTALDASALGHVIGQASNNRIYRWSATGGFEVLESIGEVAGIGDVSWDGSVIVGSSTRAAGPHGYIEAFRWKDGEGIQHLGALPSTNLESTARFVSEDGNTVAGSSNGGSWIWTAAAGMTKVEHPTSAVVVNGLSPDGSAYVGELNQLDSAYVWTPGDGYVLIDSVSASAASRGARVVVGGSAWANPGSYDAFIWDAASGTRDVKSLLEDTYGLDLTGWTLKAAVDVSYDGRTIAGWGINPAGKSEGWVAVLPPQCDDGLDNDSDSLSDAADPECAFPTWDDESNACGIGFELALIVPLLQRLYLRRRERCS